MIMDVRDMFSLKSKKSGMDLGDERRQDWNDFYGGLTMHTLTRRPADREKLVNLFQALVKQYIYIYIESGPWPVTAFTN